MWKICYVPQFKNKKKKYIYIYGIKIWNDKIMEAVADEGAYQIRLKKQAELENV
jgi:hypothetical protein